MDEVKLRDAEEIDVKLDCPCGTSFRVYLPDTPYQCPNCTKEFVISLVVRQVPYDENSWKMVGYPIDD
jgi:hypothetical protein